MLQTEHIVLQGSQLAALLQSGAGEAAWTGFRLKEQIIRSYHMVLFLVLLVSGGLLSAVPQYCCVGRDCRYALYEENRLSVCVH